MNLKSKTVLLKIIKIFFVVLVLYFVFNSTDLNQVKTKLEDLNFLFLFLFFFISLPMIWASSMKWLLFINHEGSVSVLSLMNFYTISYFVNLFTPSTVGGDVSRSISLGTKIKSHSSAFSATFYERLTGLIAMLLIVLSSYVYSPLIRELLGNIGLVFLIIFALMFSALVFENTRMKILSILEKVFLTFGIFKEKFKSIFFKLKSISNSSKLTNKTLGKAFFWALVFHFLAILNVYLASLSISCTSISISDLAFVVPLVLLVLSIPITPGGLGIQEGAFFAALTRIGASPDEAILIAGLLRFKTLVLAGIGGVLLLVNKKS